MSAYYLEAQQHLKTANDWIRFAVSTMNASEVFHGHGSDNPYDEAIHLVLTALKLPAEQLNPFLEARVLPSEAARLAEWIHKRCVDRLPLPYITGEAWLTGLPFHVDESVLIPRSFIAELLEKQLENCIDSPDIIGNVLDLCTGSGCLAILAAQAFPHAIVAASDISPSALAVAARNLTRHGREDIDLIEADLFDSDAFGVYDLILCNPPYVNDESMDALPPEYQAEPGLALAGGIDGMNLIRQILQQAPAHLSPRGLLILEIGHERPHFEVAFPQLDVSWLDVSAGDDQVLMVTREQLIAADL